MKVRSVASGLLALAIFGASAALLWRVLRDLDARDIVNAVRATTPAALAVSLLATAISFACLAYYERFAAERVVPGRLRAGYAAFVGAVAHAVSNTLGFHALTGTAVRYRLYRQRGLRGVEIARLTLLVGFCVVLGSFNVLCLALLDAGRRFAWAPIAGVAGLLAVCVAIATYPAWSMRLRLHDAGPSPIARRAWLGPLGIGLVEAVAAIGALYALLPGDAGMPFAAFVALVSGAMLLGVLSHAPGGIGVFETTVLTAFPAARRSEVLAALLLYRSQYNLLPFAVAALALAVQQWRAGSVGRRIPAHQPLLREMQTGQRAHADRAMTGAPVGRGDAE